GAETALYGHVNQMLRYGDDGTKTTTDVLDNGSNETRLGLRFTNPLTGGWDLTVGGKVEAALRTTSSVNQSLNNTFGTGMPPFPSDSLSIVNDSVEMRYADAWLDSRWGRVSLGRGDGAARFAQRVDLSGTDLANNWDNRRSYAIRWKDALGVDFANLRLGDTFRTYEGMRTDRVRYDTPEIGGFKLGISRDNGRAGNYEIGLTWGLDLVADALEGSSQGSSAGSSALLSSMAADNDALKLRFALGYSNNPAPQGSDNLSNADPVDDRLVFSGSVLIPGGFNVTGGWGQERFQAVNNVKMKSNSSYFIKGGWRSGAHAVSVDYTKSSDIAFIAGTGMLDAKSIGAAYSYRLSLGEKLNLDTYVGYERYSADNKTGNQDPEDIDVWTAGVRVPFNVNF
ncbi:MAG TPA: porin, partial [Chromatiales bacterium]|nr:porin [Chromatiales bacterium]